MQKFITPVGTDVLGGPWALDFTFDDNYILLI